MFWGLSLHGNLVLVAELQTLVFFFLLLGLCSFVLADVDGDGAFFGQGIVLQVSVALEQLSACDHR